MTEKPSYEELEQRVQELELAESGRILMDEISIDTSELLSLLIKNSPVYSFLKKVSQEESEVLYVSDNYIDMCGIPPSKMVGKTMSELFPPEFAAKITHDDIDAINNKRKLKIYEELNGKHYITYKFPINQGGRYLAGHTIDITDIEQTRDDLFHLFNMSLDMICVADINTATFLKVNSAFTNILGYSQEELLNKPFLDFVHPEDLEATLDIIKHVLKIDSKVINFDNRYRCKDGSYRWLSWVSHANVEKGLTYAIARDITESKKVEESLRESERKYRNLYHFAHVGLFETSLKDGKILVCNQRFCDLVGFPSVESAIGKDILQIYKNPADREIIINILRKHGYISDYVIHVKNTVSGELLWLEFSARIDSTSDIAEGTIINITERKHAEEEKLKLQERLSRAERMESLGVLAGGVAHDLNNVLGVVLGHSELLLLKADDQNSTIPSLKSIMKGGQKAAAIVDDLLTLARRGVARRDVLNLNTIVGDCQQSPETASLLLHHPSVEIKTDLEADLLNIAGSAVHLSKSLYNLISNASEALPRGGTVTIKTTNQYLDNPVQGYESIDEGDYVVLSVSDEGEGIDGKDIKRIFEPFYTKKVMGRSGTGLGLAVVWGTVKDHQGYINIQSKIGKGSIFTLFFPATRKQLPTNQVFATISEYMGNGESILIVDDVQEQREIATVILEELNYTVSSVKSGEEAVAYVQENQVDLMVLDMIMDPGMDGLDTYKSVLELYPEQKAIIVSGYSESSRVKAVQSLGAGTYVKKPYLVEKIGLVVKEELDRAR